MIRCSSVLPIFSDSVCENCFAEFARFRISPMLSFCSTLSTPFPPSMSAHKLPH